MDFLTRLQTLENMIQDNKIKKAKLEEKRDSLEAEYKSLLADLEAEGVKESDLAETISKLEKEIEQVIVACETELK